MAKGTGVSTQSILVRPDSVQAVVLAAGTGQAFDVPTGMAYVAFSMDQDFWVRYGSTAAAVPSTSSTSLTTNAELNPTVRNIQSTATTSGISIVSAFACNGSLNWYKAG